MNRFVFGTVIGALLMYGAILYGPAWFGQSNQWVDETASEFRGDSRRKSAEDVLR